MCVVGRTAINTCTSTSIDTTSTRARANVIHMKWCISGAFLHADDLSKLDLILHNESYKSAQTGMETGVGRFGHMYFHNESCKSAQTGMETGVGRFGHMYFHNAITILINCLLSPPDPMRPKVTRPRAVSIFVTVAYSKLVSCNEGKASGAMYTVAFKGNVIIVKVRGKYCKKLKKNYSRLLGWSQTQK